MSQRIVHVGRLDKFILPFVDYIKREFPAQDHLFQFFLESKKFDPKTDVRDVCVQGVSGYLQLLQLLHSADKIILHSMFSKKLFILLLLQPWLLRKCFWVVWGGDLYFIDSHSPSLLTKAFESLRRIVLGRIFHIVTNVRGDYELIRKRYNPCAVLHESFVYESNLFKEHALSKRVQTKNINVLVGNSATRTNCHLEVFHLLKPLVTPEVDIYVPLNYGDRDYAEEVIAEGKKLFGDHFHPITDFMKFDDYIDFLNGIDIAVMGHDRQQAFGNIITLLGFGKKVFLRDTITTWESLKYLGVTTFPLGRLDLNPHFPESARNSDVVKLKFSREELRKSLDDIFSCDLGDVR